MRVRDREGWVLGVCQGWSEEERERKAGRDGEERVRRGKEAKRVCVFYRQSSNYGIALALTITIH